MSAAIVSPPDVLYHVLLALVVGSGVLGLILQQYLPSLMKIEVPAQAIVDQLYEVRRRILDVADRAVVQLDPVLGMAGLVAQADLVVRQELANHHLGGQKLTRFKRLQPPRHSSGGTSTIGHFSPVHRQAYRAIRPLGRGVTPPMSEAAERDG